MHDSFHVSRRLPRNPRFRGGLSRLASALVLLTCGFGSGCVAVSNPVANGLPVRRLPTELLAVPRGDKRTIPLTLLRQATPDAYRLAPGDVLGVWVEGIIGERNVPPPVHMSDTSA